MFKNFPFRYAIIALWLFLVKEVQRRSRIPVAKRYKSQHHRDKESHDSVKRSPLNVSIGAKRILNKLRKMAKHIVKKMKNRAGSVPLG